MKKGKIILFFPPGWSLLIGGPHIALPMIKKFLGKHNIDVEIVDLNIRYAKKNNLYISKKDIATAIEKNDINRLNEIYFNTQNKADQLAKGFNGTLDIQEGYKPLGFNKKSSNSVREHFKKNLPYTLFFKDIIKEKILNENPSIIGINVTVSEQILPAFHLAYLIREFSYDGVIILGGNIFTRIGKNNIPGWVFDYFDGIVFYQGEEALLELFKLMTNDKQRDLSNVPNLLWRTGKKIILNTVKNLDFNKFESPDFSDINLSDYWGTHYVPILGAYGCYYGKCVFCDIPYSWGKKGFLGYRKYFKLIDDIQDIHRKKNIFNFKFVEESLNPSILKNFIDSCIQKDIHINFEGYARMDKLFFNNDFLKRASKVGLKKLYIGLEIYDPKDRYILGKNDFNNIEELLIKLNDNGIKAHIFTIVGFPGTGVEHAISTLEFLVKNKEYIDTVDISPFYYAKHTNIPLIKKEVNENEDWSLEYKYSGIENKILSYEEVLELSEYVENAVWQFNPLWLHPLYRLYSPWNN